MLEPLDRATGLSDGRSAGQRRADALVEVFGLAARRGDLPDAGGARPQLHYVIPAGWAAGQLSPPFRDLVRASLPGTGTGTGTDPGRTGETLAPEGACDRLWTGPQIRSRIEAMLCDVRITRVLLGPTGQVHGLEPLTDSITAVQRRALLARDRGCTRHPPRSATPTTWSTANTAAPPTSTTSSIVN